MKVDQLVPSDVKVIESWTYPTPFDVYARNRDSLEPFALCFGVRDRENQLIGYVALGAAAYGNRVETDCHAVDLAFALSPLRMRQGHGVEFVRTASSFAIRHAEYIGADRVRAVIEHWNHVALSVCREIGFIEASATDSGDVMLTRSVNAAAPQLSGLYLG